MKVSKRVYKAMELEAKKAEERAVQARKVADEKKANLANVEMDGATTQASVQV